MQTASGHLMGQNSKVNRQRVIKESLKYFGQIIKIASARIQQKADYLAVLRISHSAID